MSGPNENVAEFEQQQKELDQDAQKQAEKGDELSRSLEELRITQHELINNHTIEAINKWKILVSCMEAAETKGLEREANSRSRVALSNLVDKFTPHRYKDNLPIPDVLQALQKTQNEAESLRGQADTLERLAAELFADSAQLGERVKSLDEDVQNCVTEAQAEVVQLRINEERSKDRLVINRRKLDAARDTADEALSKASQWEAAKDITKFIPGINLLTYPVTKSFTTYYTAKHATFNQRLSDLGDEREDLNIYLQLTHARIDELHDSSQRLRAIGESGCATAAQAEQTKMGARALGQRCVTTATSALITIQAVSSVGIRLNGKGAILYMQERGNILDALGQHIQHINSSEEGTYSSLVLSATRGLEQSLLNLQTSKFLEFHNQKKLEIGSDMGDL